MIQSTELTVKPTLEKHQKNPARGLAHIFYAVNVNLERVVMTVFVALVTEFVWHCSERFHSNKMIIINTKSCSTNSSTVKIFMLLPYSIKLL
jgi:hypothetical protein